MKKKVLLILLSAVIITALIVSGVIFLKPGKTVNIPDYIDYELSSVNGYGSVSFSLDEEELEKTVTQLLKINEDDSEKLKSVRDELKSIEENIEFEIATENDGHLSNGDKVIVNVIFKGEEKASASGLKLIAGEKEITVDGLEEAQKADLFGEEYLDLSFTGRNGDGKCSLKSKNEYIKYSADKSEKLGNGDKITISYTLENFDEAEKYFAEKGFVIEKSGEKEIEISSLSDFYKASKKDIDGFIDIFGSFHEESWSWGYGSETATTEDVFRLFCSYIGFLPGVYDSYFDDIKYINTENTDFDSMRIPKKSFESFCRDVFNVSNPKELKSEDVIDWENTVFRNHGYDEHYLEKDDTYYYFNRYPTEVVEPYFFKLDRYEELGDGTYKIYVKEYRSLDYGDSEEFNKNIVFRAGLKDINGKKMWSVFEFESPDDTGVKVVTTEKLHVRSGPGLDYDVLYTLDKNEKIIVYPIYNSEWIKLDEGKYVFMEYLEVVI